MTAAEATAAARLVEQLLVDPELRARFRRDPVGTSRAAGVETLAAELAAGPGQAFVTLDQRESRSSLAGVVMAAALEGISGFELGSHLLAPEDAAAASPPAAQVLSRVRLPVAVPPDPDQYGMAGGGGPVSPEARAVLESRNITLDADGRADFAKGRIDPRLAGALLKLSEKHHLTISATSGDHPRSTTGGSVSNHWYGRALDIAAVDGEIVRPGSAAARRLAAEIARLDPSIRPGEVGAPWALGLPGYFTDGAHQNHIHIAFDDPIPARWRPPDGLDEDAAGGAGPVVADDVADNAPETDHDSGDPPETDDESDDDEGRDEDDGGGMAGTAGTAGDGTDGGDGDDDDDDDEEDDGDGEEDDGDGEEDDGDGDEEDDEQDGDGDEEDDDSDDDDAPDGSDPTAQPDRDPAVPDLAGAAGDYPGDDAAPVRVAEWMAGHAHRRGLPPELPVMAALVESGMRNVAYGDADSLGLFQMRQAIWDKGEYAGFAQHAERQLDWFLDHAEAVKAQRLASGRPVDAAHYGDWIAEIERPALQYRGRYQARLDEARALLRDASSGAGPALQDRALDIEEERSHSNDARVLQAVDPRLVRRPAR